MSASMTPSIGRNMALRTTILLLALLLCMGLNVSAGLLKLPNLPGIALAWLVSMLLETRGADVERPAIGWSNAIIYGMTGAIGGGGSMLLGSFSIKVHTESPGLFLAIGQDLFWFMLTVSIIKLVVMLMQYLTLSLRDASDASTTTLLWGFFVTVFFTLPWILLTALVIIAGLALRRYHVISGAGYAFHFVMWTRYFQVALGLAMIFLAAMGVIIALAAFLRKIMGRAPIEA